MILARACGRFDVDAMLDEMTPEQFGELFASWIIAQDENDRQQAEVLAAIHNASVSVAISNGAELNESHFIRLDKIVDGTNKRRRIGGRAAEVEMRTMYRS